jgi:tRNA uridine 5-carboxymethylaminomethyl modification enzyme
LTRTTPETHAIIRAHLHESASYSDRLAARGPRYCPSVEDKIVKFPDRHSHQVFLEPEGVDSDLVYPNGISTSLGAAAQAAFVRTIPGLERAEIVRPGYAIEYDYIDPRALTPALAVRACEGLFFAGQVNGTTGYEEAAAQGLVAGLNAARVARDDEAVHFDRAGSYIGVMIDDLVTRGVTEPYRMFTSRVEYRLALRADNADQRLTEWGYALGCVGAARAARYRDKAERLARAKATLGTLSLSPQEAVGLGISVNQDGQRRSGLDLLDHDAAALAKLRAVAPDLDSIDARIAAQVARDAKYRPYIARQQAEAARAAADEGLPIPPEFDFAVVAGLSNELRERLEALRPESLGRALRIEGMTPAAGLLLAAHLRGRGGRRAV